MKAVLQVVSDASVKIDGKIFSQIGRGLLVLVGIEDLDSQEDIQWLSNKIANMRIFVDDTKTMNLSVKDISGEILIVSQFTLQASTKKGNRPSYTKASKPAFAIPMYEKFVATMSQDLGNKVKTGVFGADMKVALTNDGPVTIVIDSQSRV